MPESTVRIRDCMETTGVGGTESAECPQQLYQYFLWTLLPRTFLTISPNIIFMANNKTEQIQPLCMSEYSQYFCLRINKKENVILGQGKVQTPSSVLPKIFTTLPLVKKNKYKPPPFRYSDSAL